MNFTSRLRVFWWTPSVLPARIAESISSAELEERQCLLKLSS